MNPWRNDKVLMARKWKQDFKSSLPLHCFPPKSEGSLKEWRKQLPFGRKRKAFLCLLGQKEADFGYIVQFGEVLLTPHILGSCQWPSD